MAENKKREREALDMLIDGYANLPKGSLSPNGEGYLRGLQQARKIVFGDKNNMQLQYEKLLKKEAIQFDLLPLDIVTRINKLDADIKNLRKEYKHAPNILKRELRVKNKIDLGICDAIRDWIKVQPSSVSDGFTSEKSAEQLHPDHYKAGNMDVIAFCHHHSIDFCRGNIIKYVTRAGKKKSDNPLKEIEDLKKAKVYLDREIAKLEESQK